MLFRSTIVATMVLASIFFWQIVRPDLMPGLAILLLGLLEDLVSGGAPGLWAGGFVAAFAFIIRNRDMFEGLPGTGLLIGFTGALTVASAAAYVLAWAAYAHAPPLAPLFLQGLLTALLYPIVANFSAWVHRRIVGPMRDRQ